VVPGDLLDGPAFGPLGGTRQERVDRIVTEILELGAMPLPGDVAWFRFEPGHG
jgi:hypothetical protein